ncbi:hypothetical protein [[Clostridium] colinum]|uniref:hypothetical protein n=1 Tax=[Clostridium] colinum TaxID=36835 RepID=UPI0020248BD1|nr:hypothetical protein [[Clostridium] colinum]
MGNDAEEIIEIIITPFILYFFFGLFSYIGLWCIGYENYWNFKLPLLLLMAKFIFNMLFRNSGGEL